MALEFANRLRAARYEVRTVAMDVCEKLVVEEHYAHAGPNTAVFRHGLFEREEPGAWPRADIDWCLGVAWWIPPTRAAAEATWRGDWTRVLSLSRLVVRAGVPKNAASFLIARSIRLIRASKSWDCLVTYADTWREHVGTIYRATNWEYCGLTEPHDTYVDDAGRLGARKRGPKTLTRLEMREQGFESVGKYAKHKYRMALVEEVRG